MPPISDFLKYSTSDVKKMIREDFEASEAHRSLANRQNWFHNKYFHCRDLDQPLLTTGQLENNKAPRSGYSEYGDDIDDAFIENSMFLPYLRSVILTALAIMVNTLFPDYEHYIDYEPNDPEDAEKAVTSAFAMIRLLKEGGFHREVVKTILASLKYDIALLYIGWRREYGWIPEKIEPERQIQNWLSGEMYRSGVKGEPFIRYKWQQAAIDGVECSSVNTFNLRYEPWALDGDMDRVPWIGITYRLPKSRMHELARYNAYDKSVVAKIKDDEPMNEAERQDEAIDYERMLQEDRKLEPDASPTGNSDNFYVRVQDYFTPNGVATLINGKYLVRHRRTLGYPFRRVVAYGEESFAGEAMAYPLMGIQADLNTMYRMQRDQQDLAANPIPVVDARFFGSREEIESISFDPREPIILTKSPPGVDSRTAVFFLVPPGNTAPDIFASSSAALQMGERVSSVSDNTQGVARPGNRTATEAIQMSQGVGIRQDFQAKMYEDELIIGGHQNAIRLVMVFGSKTRRFRIKRQGANDFLTFHPTDLMMKENPDLVPQGTVTRRFLQANGDLLQNAILIATTNPLLSQYVDGLESLKTLLKHTNMPGWEKIINDAAAGLGGPLDQEDENILLSAGKAVPISPADDHQKHISVMTEFLQSEAFLTVPIEHLDRFKEHIQLHQQAIVMASQAVSPVASAGGGAPGGVRSPGGNIRGGLAVGAPNARQGPVPQAGGPSTPGAGVVGNAVGG